MRNEVIRRIYAGFLVAGCLGVASAGDGNEWPQFRGPGGSGIAQDPKSSGVPTEWDTTNNVAWRIDVPGLGWSSPIVWGNRVFLTTAVDAQGTEEPEEGFYLGKDRGGRGEHRWLVLACDLNTGARLWERLVHQAVPPRTHLKSSYASATPVTDGERVYAWFGEFGLLVALNAADGVQVWSFSEPPRKSRENWGFGASPVMHGGRVYLVHDNEEDAYVAAFDASTGKEIWRVKRPPETNWSTPLVWQNDQRTELVVAATGGVTSYDLNGRSLWELRGMSSITVPNPVAGNGLVYVGSGFVADRQKPLYAIRPGAAGDISLKEGETESRYVAWVQQGAAPYVPSFLVAGQYVYVIKDNGQLSCYDAVTGASVYEERLRGHFTASPWMCGDKLFFLNERGDTYVVQTGPTFRLLATNTLERLCLATPAVACDHLLIRTSARLYCIGSDQ
jgi:outer membrane protein assembly factor BamB